MADRVPVPKDVSLRVLRTLRERKELWRFVSRFCRAAEDAGGSTYLVGGIVRDLIEGRSGRDVDLMVTGIGFEGLGKLVRGLPQKALGIRRIVEAGRQFAVYKVFVSWSREEIDVALARSERSTGPGHRHFEIRTDGIDARQDAARRDFTINSLMVSFRTSGDRVTGEVIDFFGGMEDLRRKRIRGVGDPGDRIREDPLRILRAIRQKNERPGYVIERRTWRTIRHEAKDRIGRISDERLIGELGKSLAANPSGTVSDLHRAGILAALLPEIRVRGSGAPARMKNRYARLERSLGSPLPETLLFANLLVDVAEDESRGLFAARKGKEARRRRSRGARPIGRHALHLPRTGARARRLHIPRLRRVVRIVEDLARLTHVRRLRNPNAQIEAIFAGWEDPEHLHAFYAAACGAAGRRMEDFRSVLAVAAKRPPLLTGDRILALGVPAGPDVESILEEVREATISGRIRGRKEAEELAASLCGGRGTASGQRGRKSSKRVSKSPASAR